MTMERLAYFPLVSVYGGGIAQINDGPTWLAPPLSSLSLEKVGPVDSWKPLHDRLAEYMVEEQTWDELEEAAAAPVIVKLEEDAKKLAEIQALQAEKMKALKPLKARSQGNSRASSVQASSAAERLSRRNSDRSRSNTPLNVSVSATAEATQIDSDVKVELTL